MSKYIRKHDDTTVHSVFDYGALGDGKTDDTAAFQKAIDSLPPVGGIVEVPIGTYKIDSTKSVVLRSNVYFKMHPEAILVCIPNDKPRHYILKVENVKDVTIEGGLLIGDRLAHEYVEVGGSLNTHEWGHGIFIAGSEAVTVTKVNISDCAGDGISIGRGSVDVIIDDVTSTRNRRQGLTIGQSQKVRVLNSRFTETGDEQGNLGTAPKAGIDIEPDSIGTEDVEIRDCLIAGNDGAGILTYTRTTEHPIPPHIRGVKIINCVVERNNNGIEATRCLDLEIVDTLIQKQRSSGVRIDKGTVALLQDNTFFSNYMRSGTTPRAEFELFGTDTRTKKDILVLSEGKANVGRNYYK